MDSILNSIKERLGIPRDITDFDTDLEAYINSIFFSLFSLGIPRGAETPFKITGITTTWSEFTGSAVDLEGAKNYVFIKTKLMFDPPTSSFLVEALKNQLDEIEFRMFVNEDTKRIDDERAC